MNRQGVHYKHSPDIRIVEHLYYFTVGTIQDAWMLWGERDFRDKDSWDRPVHQPKPKTIILADQLEIA